MLGTPPSGLPWHSGVAVGFPSANTLTLNEFGRWRGRPVDVVATYSNWQSWSGLGDFSSTFQPAYLEGFQGRLVYLLPLSTQDDPQSWEAIAAGDHDTVWRGIAHNLVANGQPRAVIRLGWEPNVEGWPWTPSTAAQVQSYQKAYRHVHDVLKGVAPGLLFDFSIGCGSPMPDQTDRLDSLTKLYPGDDVVDIVGCWFPDALTTTGGSEAEWQQALRPALAPGAQDVVDFARQHGKGASFAEWQLVDMMGMPPAGRGDDPHFVQKMFAFFQANADVLVYEAVVDDINRIAGFSLSRGDFPAASKAYRDLWAAQ